jgi:hypothetical protein
MLQPTIRLGKLIGSRSDAQCAETQKLPYSGSLRESVLGGRHLGRSMNGRRAGMSAAPLMTAARVAAGVTSLTCQLPTSGEPP